MLNDYHYTECGLQSVFIEGLEVHTSEDGEDTYKIPNVIQLHRAIATTILTRDSGISPEELRFLRTEMGITQASLAEIMKVEPITVGRWERGEHQMDTSDEVLVRFLAAEKLDIDLAASVEEVAGRSVWKGETVEIRIDGSNPDDYRPMAA